jgi:hypothetical protein
VLSPSLLPPLLLTVRASLFPGNALAPARQLPSPEEQLLIRRRCAEAILALIPAKVRMIYFGLQGGEEGAEERSRERWVREVEEVLNVFGDSYCNRHLIYGLLELVLVRLMPELGEKGVRELWEERLS